MHKHHWVSASFLVLASIFTFPAAAQDAKPVSPAQPAEAENLYVRSQETKDGGHVMLQVAIRSFEKPGEPTVHLVGAVHIADKAYYDSLQKFLDAQDLVLFEGVKPGAAASDLANANDAAKVKITKSRQRLLAVLASRYKTKNKTFPAKLDDLFEGVHGTMARVGKAATVDAWGHEQILVIETQENKQTLDIVSLGSDNKQGGDDAAADLHFKDQKPLTKDEKSGGGEGVQVQLANALGLEFQLAAVDYNREKWRNSDMTIDELEDKLKESGTSGGALFSMLDGSSFMSKAVGLLLGVVASSPEMSNYLKAMVVETIAHADDLMESQAASLGKGMGDFMKVIVIDRNTVVFNDLEKALNETPRPKGIALFYGAGHLPDMEKRLLAMGYTFTGTQWKDAVDVDASKVPGGKAGLRNIRAQVTAMIPKKNAPKKEDKPAEADPAK